MIKAMSVACVLMLTVVCLGPCLSTDDTSAATTEAAAEPVGLPVLVPIAFGAVIGGLAVWAYKEYFEGRDGATPPVPPDPEPVTPEPTEPAEIYDDYYRMEAEKTQTALQRSTADLSSMMGLDAGTWYYTNSYWNRSVEQIVASEWSETGSFNANTTLKKAEVYSNMSALYYNWQALADASYYTERNDRSVWNGMSYDIQMSWKNFTGGSNEIFPDFVSYCVPTDGHDKVYIDNDLPEDVCNETSRVIYVTGATGTLTAENGTTYTLSCGRNSIENYPTGIYTLGIGSGYAGSFIPVAGGADLSGAVALNDTGNFIIVTADGDGMTMITSYGSSTPVSSFGYVITHGSENTVIEVDMDGTLVSWNNLISEFENTVSRTVTTGSNAWKLFDTLGEASQLVSVSAIMPNIENLSLTDDQIYALSLLSMIEMSEWYDRTASRMNVSDLYMSAESLELKCHGKILDGAGNTLADDVIFTPFNYIRDQQISSAKDTVWTQPGVAVVWAIGPMSSWDGNTDTSAMRIVTLTEGCTLQIDSMTYRGETVENLTLEIRQMQKMLTDIYSPHTEPPELPTFADWTIYVRIAFMLLGVVILMLGIYTRNFWIMLLGGIVAGVGWIYGGNIANLLYDWFGIGRT